MFKQWWINSAKMKAKRVSTVYGEHNLQRRAIKRLQRRAQSNCSLRHKQVKLSLQHVLNRFEQNVRSKRRERHIVVIVQSNATMRLTTRVWNLWRQRRAILKLRSISRRRWLVQWRDTTTDHHRLRDATEHYHRFTFQYTMKKLQENNKKGRKFLRNSSRADKNADISRLLRGLQALQWHRAKNLRESRKIQHEMLKRWHRISVFGKAERAAEEYYYMGVVCKMFGQWKREAVCSRMSSGYYSIVLWKTVLKCFLNWKEFIILRALNGTQKGVADLHWRKQELTRCFNAWQLRRVEEKVVVAAQHFFGCGTKRILFGKWKDVLEEEKLQRVQTVVADLHWRNRTIRTWFYEWADTKESRSIHIY